MFRIHVITAREMGQSYVTKQNVFYGCVCEHHIIDSLLVLAYDLHLRYLTSLKTGSISYNVLL